MCADGSYHVAPQPAPRPQILRLGVYILRCLAAYFAETWGQDAQPNLDFLKVKCLRPLLATMGSMGEAERNSRGASLANVAGIIPETVEARQSSMDLHYLELSRF